MNKILVSKMDGKRWFCYECKISAFLHINKKTRIRAGWKIGFTLLPDTFFTSDKEMRSTLT